MLVQLLKNNIAPTLIIKHLDKNKYKMKRQINLCDAYLNAFAQKSNLFRKHTSYHYKHEVERFFNTYISNDAFIDAAKLRFECKLANNSKQNYLIKFKLKKPKPVHCWIATDPMGECEMYTRYGMNLFKKDNVWFLGSVKSTTGIVKNDRVLKIIDNL